MSLIKTVIIDDEYFNRELIALLIAKQNNDFEVCGSAGSLREGVKLINAIGPDVVFLDIKMPDGSGFDLLAQFETLPFEVIFVTGFDNYAIKAFEAKAIEYILKPIDLDKFSEALDKVKKKLERVRQSNK